MSEQLFTITLRVNGIAHRVEVPARRLLSDCLRHDLGLTGTHVGCEHGVCGACTVLVDGAPMRSCLLLAVSMDGAELTTVEGLADPDGTLSPVQQAFADCHGLQCGFCTPGFLTTITAGLRQNPRPSTDQARDMIGGNLCRCTGYQNIVKAVLRAAELASGRVTAPDEAEDAVLRAAELASVKVTAPDETEDAVLRAAELASGAAAGSAGGRVSSPDAATGSAGEPA